MPNISTLIVRVFDEPRANRRHVKRDQEGRTRFEAKGRKSRRSDSSERG